LLLLSLVRRGAAFGIAGIVKGLGIMAMKNYGIMDTLKTAVEDKKEASSREVGLLLLEMRAQEEAFFSLPLLKRICRILCFRLC
jgi:hypothetical protein